MLKLMYLLKTMFMFLFRYIFFILIHVNNCILLLPCIYFRIHQSLQVCSFWRKIYTFSSILYIRSHSCLLHLLLSLTHHRSTFDNLELLKDGLSGALVTGLIIGVHEIGHILAARESGIKLGVPYFVPSWQVKTLYKKLVN